MKLKPDPEGSRKCATFMRRAKDDFEAGFPPQSGNFWYLFQYFADVHPQLNVSGNGELEEFVRVLCAPGTAPNLTGGSIWGSLLDR